jgi:hypothetical protein
LLVPTLMPRHNLCKLVVKDTHLGLRNTIMIRLALVILTKKVVCNRSRSFAPQKTTVVPKRDFIEMSSKTILS